MPINLNVSKNIFLQDCQNIDRELYFICLNLNVLKMYFSFPEQKMSKNINQTD